MTLPIKKEQKVIILEKECPNQYDTVRIYSVPDVIQWYLDGYNWY